MEYDKSKNADWSRIESGIRCRKHPARKHGVKPDMYFVLRFTVDGKTHQEALGWASEGVTLDKARLELARLREAKRTGKGARSLRERRTQEAQKRKEKDLADQVAKAARITIAEYWRETYWPAQTYKASGSRMAENALWNKWIEPVIGDTSLVALSAFDVEKIKRAMQLINRNKPIKKPCGKKLKTILLVPASSGMLTNPPWKASTSTFLPLTLALQPLS